MTAVHTDIQPSPADTPILSGRLAELLGRLVNRWSAGVIARLEREATLVALRDLGDRDLKDIGIRRHQIGDALTEIAGERTRLQRERQSC